MTELSWNVLQSDMMMTGATVICGSADLEHPRWFIHIGGWQLMLNGIWEIIWEYHSQRMQFCDYFNDIAFPAGYLGILFTHSWTY